MYSMNDVYTWRIRENFHWGEIEIVAFLYFRLDETDGSEVSGEPVFFPFHCLLKQSDQKKKLALKSKKWL